MRVRYLPQAQTDLQEIGDFYREAGGAALARTMIAKIRESVQPLGDHPRRAPPYELAPGVRRLVVAQGVFLVFYRVRDTVEVLHIRRAEREPLTALGD
jgi:plasmid stabilization system protein ParE